GNHMIRYSFFILSFVFAATGCIADRSQSELPEEPLRDQGDSIVGGSPASISKFPWQISLQEFTLQGTWHHFCGGSILSVRYVLTAHHCVQGTDDPASIFPAGVMRVAAGASQLSKMDVEGQIRQVEDVLPLPGWDGFSPDGKDISLLRLSEPLHFNKNV